MMAKAAQPPARRARLRAILAPYQPRRRSSSPACLIWRDSWVYSAQRPLGATIARAVDSWSRLIAAPACRVVALGLSGGWSGSEAAQRPAGDLGGAGPQ